MDPAPGRAVAVIRTRAWPTVFGAVYFQGPAQKLQTQTHVALVAIRKGADHTRSAKLYTPQDQQGLT